MAKRIVHDTWVELSQIHNELFSLGTENDETTVARRKALLDEQQPLIERYNSVYETKEAFFAGEVSEEELQKVVDGTDNQDEEKPVNYTSLSDVDLVKRIHAARTSITRYNNQLRYQQYKSAETDNPMPNGERRDKIERSLAVRSEELNQLLAIYEERGSGGAA